MLRHSHAARRRLADILPAPFLIGMALLLGPTAVRVETAPAGASPVTSAPTVLPDNALNSLAGSIRGYVVQAIPVPLYTKDKNWGHTRKVANGLNWNVKGPGVYPKVVRKPKNDGIWTRLVVTTPRLRDSLVFDLRNLQTAPNGPSTFDAFVSFDAEAEYERQNWKGGTRVYSGSTRVRFRIKATLHCEATSRFENTGGLVPDLIFRLRVVKSDLGYDNFVCEHIAGLGGEAAKVIGDVVKGGLHRFQPDLERELLAKANATIVKSADTREVRLSLNRLLGH